MNNKISIALIAAISNNNCVGKNNTIPWYAPEDLKLFQKLTLNKPVIMGSKTWLSLPFKPLKNRLNIVLSKTLQLENIKDKIIQTENLKSAIDQAENYLKNKNIDFDPTQTNNFTNLDEIMIIGGSEIYKQTIDLAQKLYISKVDLWIDKPDALFPEIDLNIWKQTNEKLICEKNEKGPKVTLKEYCKI